MTTIRQAFPPNGPEYPIDPEEKLFDPLEAVTGIPAPEKPASKIVAQAVETLPGGVSRAWSRYDDGRITRQDATFSGGLAWLHPERPGAPPPGLRWVDTGPRAPVEDQAFDDPAYDYAASPACPCDDGHPYSPRP
jgi:hypothetical protein